ncbi:MAG: hypothetical protein GF313_04150 [Caldithrix sp.]|nr:hypothetical protein [Caldithrix sp.]
MTDIIRFHVPAKMEYVNMVENFSSLVSDFLKKENKSEHYSDLRAVLNEVFINVIKHSDTVIQKEVVRFQFEFDHPYFTISVYDYGPGFQADGHFPPYPREIIGNRYHLRDVVDGSVGFTISDPFTIRFYFMEKEQTDKYEKTLDQLEDHGLGISIITKLMDTVNYSYIGQGKFDWKLVRKLN